MAVHFRRDLTIRQLRALGAVHSMGSVTAAARLLNLTQPAVTLQLRNLEALAGLPLIQRTGEEVLLISMQPPSTRLPDIGLQCETD